MPRKKRRGFNITGSDPSAAGRASVKLRRAEKARRLAEVNRRREEVLRRKIVTKVNESKRLGLFSSLQRTPMSTLLRHPQSQRERGFLRAGLL